MRFNSVLLLGLTMACSSSAVVLPLRPTQRVTGALPVDDRPEGTVYRDELEGAIQAGLGHFLRRIDVRAVTRADDLGQRVFVGFEILALRPAKDWLKFDFAPGDIVTRIDGVSVEHYDGVLPMFEGLSRKDHFEVQLIRAGDPKTIIVNIRQRNRAPRATAS